MISSIVSLTTISSFNSTATLDLNATTSNYLYTPPSTIDIFNASNATNLTDGPYPVFPSYIRTTSMVFCIVIMCLGVIGNVMVPIVIFKTKDMRNSTNIFLVNLSVADLMVLLVCTPTVLVEVNSRPETWVLGREMCKAVPFVELTVAHASVLTILAISFERYYAICKPLKAGYICTKARASLICLLAWFVAAVFTRLKYIWKSCYSWLVLSGILNMTENITIISSLDRLCRTCLTERHVEELRPLFENAVDTQIMDVSCIKVELNDGLPTHICNDCYCTLNIAFNFKIQCQKSDSQLRNALFSGQAIIYRSITILGNDSDELHIQNYEEVDSDLPLLNDNEVVSEVELPMAIQITNKVDNENKSEIIYLSTDNERKEPDYIIKDSMTSSTFDGIESNDNNVCISVPKEISEPIVSQSAKIPSGSLQFPCSQCGKKFKHETSLKSHLIKHGKKLKCEVCGKEFNLMRCFRDHLKTHRDYRPYKCDVCSKTFSLPTSLVKHMRIHGGEKKHLCTICGKRFFEPNHLTIHMRIHTGEKPIVCSICGKRFSDPHGLMVHNKVHTGERRYQCNTCGKRFGHSFVLKAHKRTHTGEKPYKCSFCEASFGTSSYLTIHTRTHTQEKPYKCDSCPKSFVSKCGLAAHTRTHTGEKKFQCAVCGKRAGRAADLQIHMRSHTGEKPYACNECPKRYHTSSNLATHKRTHLGIKDQVCTACGKAFGDPRTLKSHYRTHTGERPYVCQICGKCYTQAGQLAAHRKTHPVNQGISTNC